MTLLQAMTTYSLHESGIKVEELVAWAKDRGHQAVVLNEVNTLASSFRFLSTCQREGLRGFVALEKPIKGRGPLNFLATDYASLQGLFALHSRKEQVERQELEDFLKDSPPGLFLLLGARDRLYSDLNRAYLSQRTEEEILEKMAGLMTGQDPAYMKNQALLDEALAKREKINQEVKQWRQEIKRAEGEKKKEDFQARLDELLKDRAENNGLIQSIRKQIKDVEKDEKKKADLEQALALRRQEVLSVDQALAAWVQDLDYLVGLVGPDRIIYQLAPAQRLGMDLVKSCLEEVDKRGIRVFPASNVRRLSNDPAHRLQEVLIRSLRNNKRLDEEELDDLAIYHSDQELAAYFQGLVGPDRFGPWLKEREEFFGSKEILVPGIHLPQDNHYPSYKGAPGQDRLSLLRQRALANKHLVANWGPVYEERLDFELEVIDGMDYVDYILIVAEYIRQGRILGAKKNKGLSYSVGPGRGSACGSLLCYLMEITKVDPVEHNLLFERFLNPDRVSPPDIDTDFAMDVRDDLQGWMVDRYGERAVSSVGTHLFYKPKSAIQAAARILGSTREYARRASYLSAMIEEDRLAENMDLFEKELSRPISKEILEGALLLEGLKSAHGVHAAALIVSSGEDLERVLPLRTKDSLYATEFDKKECESLGLLKHDFLGLKTLDILTKAIRLINDRQGVRIDLDQIRPDDPEVFREIYAKGNTDGVFQFSSDGMKEALRKIAPDSFEDIVLANAVHRPGPAQYIDQIAEAKASGRKKKGLTRAIEEILEPTYGSPVYQEQIMQIFNTLGFSLAEADIVRRSMTSKDIQSLNEFKDRFLKGLGQQGVNPQAAQHFWEELMEFVKYAFNKSHSVSYSLASYYCAYLKYYYPIEFLTATLSFEEDLSSMDQNKIMVKRAGVRLLAPDINKSETNYSIDGSAIYTGFGNIKGVVGVGQTIVEERQQGGPFTSVINFLSRVSLRKNEYESLVSAGAFDGFGVQNRSALLLARQELMGLVEDYKKWSQIEEPTEGQVLALAKVTRELARYELPIAPLNLQVAIEREREVLGTSLALEPLSIFSDYVNKRDYDLLETKSMILSGLETRHVIAGEVRNLRIIKTRKKGEEMAFFSLLDERASLPLVAFPEQFEAIKGWIQEGMVLSVLGQGGLREREGSEAYAQFVVDSARRIQVHPELYLIKVDLLSDIYDMLDLFRPYYSDQGLDVKFFVSQDSRLYSFRHLIDPRFFEKHPDLEYRRVMTKL